jgi:hypothetical protein
MPRRRPRAIPGPTFRLSPDAASAWIKAHDIEVAIHSFYDDDKWRVLLAAGR